jgi:hypothetical protein
VQVNIGAEAEGRLRVADLPALLEQARVADLPVAGLMCVPPADLEPAPFFALLAKLAADHGLSGLSMGMSGDFETAISLAPRMCGSARRCLARASTMFEAQRAALEALSERSRLRPLPPARAWISPRTTIWASPPIPRWQRPRMRRCAGAFRSARADRACCAATTPHEALEAEPPPFRGGERAVPAHRLHRQFRAVCHFAAGGRRDLCRRVDPRQRA